VKTLPKWAIWTCGGLAGFLAATFLSLSVPLAVSLSEGDQVDDFSTRDVDWECTADLGDFRLVVENSGDQMRSYSLQLEISKQGIVTGSHELTVPDVAPGDRRILAEHIPVTGGDACKLWVW